jgi:S1-C subfamily serine protease
MGNLRRNGLYLLSGLVLGIVLTISLLQSQPGFISSGLAAAPLAAAPAAAAASPQTVAQQLQVGQGGASEDALVAVYDKVSPAVVTITSNTRVTARGRTPNSPLPQTPQEVPEGEGAGFILDAQGHILTNNHVISGAESLDVTLADGSTMTAKVLGTDPANDLAIIQVELPAASLTSGKVATVALGDSDKVKVGQTAIAIGNPFGYERSLSVGVVSGIGRDIPSDGSRTIRGGIQTDASVNPGNSGGPLLNSAGEVVGINTAIESPVLGSVGVGFAVPINAAKRSLDSLIAGTRIAHPWLGISGQQLTAKLAQQLGLGVDKGVYVVQVIADSPAAKAGLVGAVAPGSTVPQTAPKGGDVITAVDGNAVGNVNDVASYIDSQRKVGDVVKLQVKRGSADVTLDVTLAAWPDNLQ